MGSCNSTAQPATRRHILKIKCTAIGAGLQCSTRLGSWISVAYLDGKWRRGDGT